MVPAEPAHTARGLQSGGQTCNSNFWLLWTLGACKPILCEFVCLCEKARKWLLLQAVLQPLTARAEGRLPSHFCQHPNQSALAISCRVSCPGGSSVYVGEWLFCPCCVYMRAGIGSSSPPPPPPPPPLTTSASHTPRGTTLPIRTTIHHFHIVALMRKGLIIHVRGDKIRGEKINILWACQAHLSKPCVSLCGLWHRWLRGQLCSFSS